jgi:signal transduction histidine kinase
VDVLPAVAIAVLQIAGTIVYSADESPSRWAFDAYAYALLAVGPVALLFRRRWPEAALAVTLAAAAGYAATGYPSGPAGFPALGFALVNAIMLSRRVFASAVLVVAIAVLAWLVSVRPDEDITHTSGIAIAQSAWLLLVGAASEVARIRLERRDEQAHVAREESRRRASEERLLIARELHDVLAHNISVINVQSGVALHLLDEQPAQARPALEVINEASEEALRELRSVLDVLSRGLDDGPHDGSAPWAPGAPTAGLRDIDGLVRRTRATGLDVQLAIEGEARAVPAAVELAAFRVMQEALTNIVRHAGDDARATVRLVYTPVELFVQIDDDGRAAGEAPGASVSMGRGITGMRERVHALDGTFTAGPRPGRGFRVRAQFPLDGEAR